MDEARLRRVAFKVFCIGKSDSTLEEGEERILVHLQEVHNSAVKETAEKIISMADSFGDIDVNRVKNHFDLKESGGSSETK